MTSVSAEEFSYVYENCMDQQEKTGNKFAYLSYAIQDDFTKKYQDLAVTRTSISTKDNFFDEMTQREDYKNKSLDIGKYFEEKELICFYRYVGQQIKIVKGVDY